MHRAGWTDNARPPGTCVQPDVPGSGNHGASDTALRNPVLRNLFLAGLAPDTMVRFGDGGRRSRLRGVLIAGAFTGPEIDKPATSGVTSRVYDPGT